jgi:hypothetical protein
MFSAMCIIEIGLALTPLHVDLYFGNALHKSFEVSKVTRFDNKNRNGGEKNLPKNSSQR